MDVEPIEFLQCTQWRLLMGFPQLSYWEYWWCNSRAAIADNVATIAWVSRDCKFYFQIQRPWMDFNQETPHKVYHKMFWLWSINTEYHHHHHLLRLHLHLWVYERWINTFELISCSIEAQLKGKDCCCAVAVSCLSCLSCFFFVWGLGPFLGGRVSLGILKSDSISSISFISLFWLVWLLVPTGCKHSTEFDYKTYIKLIENLYIKLIQNL